MGRERDTALQSEASFAIARRGLRLLSRSWLALTVVSLAAQLYSTRVLQVSGDERAAAMLVLLFANLAYQAIYVLLAVPLTIGALRVTRVPPDTHAIGPALAATVGFGASAVLTVVILLTGLVSEQARSTSPATVQTYWVLLALARVLALVGLTLALIRLARFAGAAFSPVRSGALVTLAAVDSLVPLWRVLAHAPPALQASHPWLYRGLLSGIQLLLAVLLVQSLLHVRRALEPLEELESATAAKPSPAPAPEPEEPEEPEEPAPEPDAPRDEPAPEPDAPRDEPDAPRDDSAPEPDAPRDDSAPDRHPGTPPQVRLLAAVLCAAAGAVLPLWDALGGSALTSFAPALPWVLAAIGVLGAVLLHRALTTSPYAARLVFLLLAVVAAGYAIVSLAHVARLRSHAIDAWPVCETGTGTAGEYIDLNQVEEQPGVDGPRLETGEPCVLASERRGEHARGAPHGDVQDGIVQIAIRFGDDRSRYLGGSVATLLALTLAGYWVFREADAES